jgi:hypothetical protein
MVPRRLRSLPVLPALGSLCIAFGLLFSAARAGKVPAPAHSVPAGPSLTAPVPAPEPAAPGDGHPSIAVRAFPLDAPVRVDGILDEPAWRHSSAAPLIQNDPDNGRRPRERTDWWIAYDDEALYLAARMYDAAPESIVCGMGRRDTWPSSDWIILNLDTFNDDRNGYEFGLSPAGAIGDAAVYADGSEDYSWDGIWSCKARRDSLGWTAEMRIPFSQLKFPTREDQVWGIDLTRHINRYQERDDLMHIPRASSGFVSRFPDLVGIRGIHPSRRIELLTYGVGKGDFQRRAKEDPFHSASDLTGNAGADITWGLTNNLTLNATLNPDFGQVEVDPAVINLSDFETYYGERRPFFVEDANSFRFGNEGTNSNWNFNWSDPTLFYSRRIGQPPQVDLHNHDYADVPGNTTILGAAKVQGTAGNTVIGALSAWTARENARLDLGGVRSSQVAEPMTTYNAVRVLYARPDGRRGLGMMVTDTWRDLGDADSRSQLPRQATVLGADGWTRLDNKGTWALRGYLIGSTVSGDSSAMDLLQRSYRHYFQRPDAGHLHYDPNRTRLNGWMGRGVLNKESGRSTLTAAVGAVSPGFEANDLGFSNRSDVINVSLVPGYRWVEPTRLYRNLWLSLATYHVWDTGGRPDQYGWGPFWNVTFANYWWSSGHLFYNPERSVQWVTRGGPAMRVPDNREVAFSAGTDDRRTLYLGFDGSAARSGDGSSSASGTLTATLRPRASIKLSLAPALSWSLDHSGWVTRIEDPVMTATYGVRYVFSDLTYRETSLATRIDWTFTPRLTLQAYLQPLIGVGSYSEFKELARPSTYTFNVYGRSGGGSGSSGSTIDYDPSTNLYTVDPDGSGPIDAFTFADPDFNYKSLKVNLVLRWEFQPGSTFYLVWTQNRTDSRDPGNFRLGRDVRSLFDTVSTNGIQVKVTKWWGI